MSNRYRREEVLRDMYDRVAQVCDKVFVTDRPTAAEKMTEFIVIRLSQPIRPYADTHSTAYLQFICHVRDRQGGIENTPALERLTDAVVGMFPINDAVLSCNHRPTVISGKVDGLGFHAVTVQTKIIIKNNSKD